MTKKIKGTALILDLCRHVGNLEHLIQVCILSAEYLTTCYDTSAFARDLIRRAHNACANEIPKQWLEFCGCICLEQEMELRR